jgi:hypothetical protein
VCEIVSKTKILEKRLKRQRSDIEREREDRLGREGGRGKEGPQRCGRENMTVRERQRETERDVSCKISSVCS